MGIKGIMIDWGALGPSLKGYIEYIDAIDLDDLKNLKPFETTTREWWPCKGQFVCYDVECPIKRESGRVRVYVKYDRKRNPHLDPEKNPDWEDSVIWGINEIIISEGQDFGDCNWQPEKNDKYSKIQWKRMTLETLYEDRERLMSIQPIRDRRFRHQIMELDDQKCVISGERTKEVLDAAHIKSVADDGSEIPQNSITLRADIHRLYDAGKFCINPETGKPDKFGCGLSLEYKKILKKARLPDDTLDRVSDALREKRRRRSRTGENES